VAVFGLLRGAGAPGRATSTSVPPERVIAAA